MKEKELLEKLNDLKRFSTQEKPSASVAEAIHVLIDCCEYILSNQPERKKREDVFIYKPDNYPGPIAFDATPSKECREYLENSCIQVMEMIASPEPDVLTIKRFKQDVDFVNSCCGVNDDLLGYGKN